MKMLMTTDAMLGRRRRLLELCELTARIGAAGYTPPKSMVEDRDGLADLEAEIDIKCMTCLNPVRTTVPVAGTAVPRSALCGRCSTAIDERISTDG